MIGWNYLAPLFQPIRSNNKISRDLVARDFPRSTPASPALSSDWFPQRRPPSPPPTWIYTWEECVQSNDQTQRSTIGQRKKKNNQNRSRAVLSWPKNTLLSSSVKYWTPLTTKMYTFTTVEHYTFRTYCVYPAIPGCDTNTIATWRHWNRRHPHVCERIKSFHGFQSRRVITATADVKKRT